MSNAQPAYRHLEFGVDRVTVRDGADGIRYLMSQPHLQHYPERMTDRLVHWAEHEPLHTFIADRKSTRLNSSHSDRSRMPSSA